MEQPERPFQVQTWRHPECGFVAYIGDSDTYARGITAEEATDRAVTAHRLHQREGTTVIYPVEPHPHDWNCLCGYANEESEVACTVCGQPRL